MLDSLKDYIKPIVLPARFPQWQQYISVLHIRQQQFQKRYTQLQVPPYSAGLQMLERILRLADIERLSVIGDNFYLYMTQIPLLLDDTRTVFDAARNGRTYHRLFAFSQADLNLSEYVISPEDNDWLKILPMTSSNYSDWESTRPLKLLWYDGMEQTFDMFTTGQLRFHTTVPQFVYWILDVPTLILKAVNWYKNNKNKVELNKYIQTEVFGAVPDDTEFLWYFKLHNAAVDVALETRTRESVLELYPRAQSQYGYIGPRFAETFDEITGLYRNVANGSSTPNAIFGFPFFVDGKSFYDVVTRLFDTCDVSHHGQFKHLRLLRDIPYIDYVCKVFALSPARPNVQGFKSRFQVLLNKWKNNIPLTLIHNQEHRALIARKLEAWSKYVQR